MRTRKSYSHDEKVEAAIATTGCLGCLGVFAAGALVKLAIIGIILWAIITLVLHVTRG